MPIQKVTSSSLNGGISAQYVDSQTVGVMLYTSQNVTSNVILSAEKNAYSAGPITIDAPYSVTLNAGSTWVIL
jgi:hypothetical protein